MKQTTRFPIIEAIQFLFIIIFWFAISPTLVGQSPYEFNKKREITIVASGAAITGTALYLRSRSKIFTTDELISLDAQDINALDRFATGRFSENANTLSDVFWLGAHFTPLIFLGGKNSRNHATDILVLYGETFLLNGGITGLSKAAFQRPRPFVFNPEVLEETKLTKKARTSFLSGHTSMTAMNTFFVAKVFADFNPDSSWKPIIWGSAIVVPAITGYLRIAAGKHYPSDVLAGYAVGATIGWLVPHLHRIKADKNNALTFDLGPSGARLVWHIR